MNYAVEQRLRFIDFLLFHYGSVSRIELTDYFGIGEATATRDFAMYRERAEGNLVLNTTTKRWVRTESFVRVYEG